MATIIGTSGNDTIAPAGVSLGVTGGLPGSAGEGIVGTAGNDSIDGGGGSNFLDYRSGPGAGPITATYAASGYAGTVLKGGANGTDTFVNIRGILGGAGNDSLIGSDDTTANLGSGSVWSGRAQPATASWLKLTHYPNLPFWIVLRGRLGDDFIDGRKSQLNQTSYFDSPHGVTITLQTSIDGSGNWFGTAADGNQVSGQAAGTYYADTLRNVTRAAGSAFDDTITGSAANDRFDASAGNDTYDGGGGFNTINYDNGVSGLTAVTVTVVAPDTGLFGFGNGSAAKGGIGGTDTLARFNDYRGTTGGDLLSGTTAAYSWNSISLRGGLGNDTINGFGNSINRADYSGAGAAVSVDLAAGTAQDGRAAPTR